MTTSRLSQCSAWMIVGLLCAGCVTTPRVTSMTMPGADLTRYKTYSLKSGDIAEPADTPPGSVSELRQALEGDVRHQLASRGLQEQEISPDVIFSYEAARRDEQTTEEGWKYQEGALLLTAMDSKTGNVVWKAHVQAIIDTHDKTHQQLNDAVTEAFKRYPSVAH